MLSQGENHAFLLFPMVVADFLGSKGHGRTHPPFNTPLVDEMTKFEVHIECCTGTTNLSRPDTEVESTTIAPLSRHQANEISTHEWTARKLSTMHIGASGAMLFYQSCSHYLALTIYGKKCWNLFPHYSGSYRGNSAVTSVGNSVLYL